MIVSNMYLLFLIAFLFFVRTIESTENYWDDRSYTACECTESVNCYCVKNRLCNSEGYIENDTGSIIENRALPVDSCSSNEVCCARPEPRSNQPVCGKRELLQKIDKTPTETGRNEFPWMAAFLYDDEDGVETFQCGSSIVNSRLILTAGRCLERLDDQNLKVSVGAWDLLNESEVTQTINVVLSKRHPDYSLGPLHDDIALLVLEEEIKWKEGVSTICLPTQDMVFPPGTMCVTTGWGSGQYGVQNISTTGLRRVDMPIVSHETCQNKLRNTALGPFFYLDRSFMCAGGNGIGACTGDSGGPLVCEKNGSYYQVGIVAGLTGCSDPEVPGMYTDINSYIPWINDNIADIEALK